MRPPPPRRTWLAFAGLGTVLGATLSAFGFTSYDELFRLFTLSDLRLFAIFATAVVLAAVGFQLHCPGWNLPARRLMPGTIPGAILFGIGWALTGGCPAAVLAQLGEGKVYALLTASGVLVGTRLGQRLSGRLHLDGGSC